MSNTNVEATFHSDLSGARVGAPILKASLIFPHPPFEHFIKWHRVNSMICCATHILINVYSLSLSTEHMYITNNFFKQFFNPQNYLQLHTLTWQTIFLQDCHKYSFSSQMDTTLKKNFVVNGNGTLGVKPTTRRSWRTHKWLKQHGRRKRVGKVNSFYLQDLANYALCTFGRTDEHNTVLQNPKKVQF